MKTNKHQPESKSTKKNSGDSHPKKQSGEFQFVDNRQIAVTQRQLQELANKHLQAKYFDSLEESGEISLNSGEFIHHEVPIQRELEQDHGAAKTKEWYGGQLASTGTTEIVESVDKSSSNIFGRAGVFLSDNIFEFQQWTNLVTEDGPVNRLIVPNLGKFMTGEAVLPAPFGDNGLSIEDNCKALAEHEMVHLKHTSERMKSGATGPTAGVPYTNAPEFSLDDSGSALKATVADLKSDIGELHTLFSGQKLPKLEKAKTYLNARVDYILSDFQTNNRNVEAPTVMRELRRYLNNKVIVQSIEKLENPKPWFALRTKIEALDKSCSNSANMPLDAPSGGCFLTTACTQYKGLPDNCEELMILRAFRDGYMYSLTDGPDLIEQYYAVAPGLVEAINDQPDAKDVYDGIYDVITYCVNAIHEDDLPLALQSYKDLVTALSREYGEA